jgi:hypothetical protein
MSKDNNSGKCTWSEGSSHPDRSSPPCRCPLGNVGEQIGLWLILLDLGLALGMMGDHHFFDVYRSSPSPPAKTAVAWEEELTYGEEALAAREAGFVAFE